MRKIRLSLVVALLCGLAASCASATRPLTTPGSHGHGRVYVIGDSVLSTTHSLDLKRGDYIELQLVSTRYSKLTGRLVPWAAPTSTDPLVLAPRPLSAPATCPANATCPTLEALAPGSVSLLIQGPSGLVCDRGRQHCVGVSAAIYRLQVNVSA